MQISLVACLPYRQDKSGLVSIVELALLRCSIDNVQGQSLPDGMGRASSQQPGNGLHSTSNGFGVDDVAPSGYNMGIANGAFSAQDMDKLRTNFPFLESRVPMLSHSQVMMDNLRRNGLPESQIEQWNVTGPTQAK